MQHYTSCCSLGAAEQALGNTDAALGRYRQALAIHERLATAAPENAQFARDLSISYNRLGAMEQDLGNTDAALGRYRQALAIRERLAAAAPENAQFALGLSISYDNLGNMERALGNSDAVLGRYRQALAIRERLAAAAPENADFARDLSVSYNNLGDMQQALGNSQAALDLYQQCLEIRERLAAAAPKNADVARDLAQSIMAVARIQGDHGAFVDMKTGVGRALAIAEAASLHLMRGWLHGQAGWASAALGDFSGARMHFEHALAQAQKDGNAVSTAWRQVGLANVEWLEGRDDAAVTLGELALAVARANKDSDLLTNALLMVGRTRHVLGDTAQAGDAYAEALELGVRDELGESAFLLGLVRREQGRTSESDALFERVRGDCADRLGKASKLYAPRYLQAFERLARGHSEEGLGTLAQAIQACAAAGEIRRNFRVLDLVGRATHDFVGIAHARELLEAAGEARE